MSCLPNKSGIELVNFSLAWSVFQNSTYILILKLISKWIRKIHLSHRDVNFRSLLGSQSHHCLYPYPCLKKNTTENKCNLVAIRLLQVEIEIRFIVEWFGVGKGPVDKWSIEELLTLKFIETFFLLKRLWLEGDFSVCFKCILLWTPPPPPQL